MYKRQLYTYSNVLREHGYEAEQVKKFVEKASEVREKTLKNAEALLPKKEEGRKLTIEEVKAAMEGQAPSKVDETIPEFLATSKEDARRRWSEKAESTRVYPQPKKGEGIGDYKTREVDRTELSVFLENELIEIQKEAFGEYSVESTRDTVQVVVALFDSLSQAFGMPLREFYQEYGPRFVFEKSPSEGRIGTYSDRTGYDWAKGLLGLETGARIAVTQNQPLATRRGVSKPDALPHTLIHEMGHYVLDLMFRNAKNPHLSEGFKKDMMTIFDWLGIKDADEALARWASDSSKSPTRELYTETVKMHETMAESFEEYFMEGKAPTPALRRAFHRISGFMLKIYRVVEQVRMWNGNRSLPREDVALNEEVREVFDRLLSVQIEFDNYAQLSEDNEFLETLLIAGYTEKQALSLIHI